MERDARSNWCNWVLSAEQLQLPHELTLPSTYSDPNCPDHGLIRTKAAQHNLLALKYPDWKTSISDQSSNIPLKSNFPTQTHIRYSSKSIRYRVRHAVVAPAHCRTPSWDIPSLLLHPPSSAYHPTPSFHKQPNFPPCNITEIRRQEMASWEQLRGEARLQKSLAPWAAIHHGRIFASAQSWNYIAEKNACLVVRLNCIHLLCRKWTPDCNFGIPLNSLCFVKHTS